jgi:hypothetical protein
MLLLQFPLPIIAESGDNPGDPVARTELPVNLEIHDTHLRMLLPPDVDGDRPVIFIERRGGVGAYDLEIFKGEGGNTVLELQHRYDSVRVVTGFDVEQARFRVDTATGKLQDPDGEDE